MVDGTRTPVEGLILYTLKKTYMEYTHVSGGWEKRSRYKNVQLALVIVTVIVIWRLRSGGGRGGMPHTVPRQQTTKVKIVEEGNGGISRICHESPAYLSMCVCVCV